MDEVVLSAPDNLNTRSKLGAPIYVLADRHEHTSLVATIDSMHGRCSLNQVGTNNNASVTLQAYQNPLEQPLLPNMKLWEVCRATSATPHFFQPLKFGECSFLDGGLQANNPLG